MNLFEVTGNEEGIREQLAARGVRDAAGGYDFREDVERWLEMAMA